MRLTDRVLAVGGTVKNIENGWQLLTIPHPFKHKEDFTIRYKETVEAPTGQPAHPRHKFNQYLPAIETYLKIRGYSPNQETIKKNGWVKCKHTFCRKYLNTNPKTGKPVNGLYCSDFCRIRASLLRKAKKNTATKKVATKKTAAKNKKRG